MRNNKKIATRVFAIALAAATVTTAASASRVHLTYANTSVSYADAEMKVIESGAWLESAYVTWNPVSEADGYNVYYKAAAEDNSSYKLLDSELIREYSSYYRADILGLAEGEYTIKVVALQDGKEMDQQITVKNLSVSAHTREGFAFSENSPMKTGSGGYLDDGTVSEEAQVVYVTADTINTVKLDVVTSKKGATTTCTGLVDILAKRQKGYDRSPLIIRMIGTITASDITGLNSSGYLQLKGCYNVTLEGVGDDATISGWGLLIRDAHNVEIRNLGIMLFPDDAISLDTANENIWVHNNDIFYGTAGSDADQAKGDGSCDVKGYSNYVTVSYNHFWDSGKSSLCGMSDSEEFFVTYHHNWFDHSDSRHPRIRLGTIHIYNNYFDGNSKYGVGVTKGASAFVEANAFRNCKYPMLSSLQGTDIYGGSKGTFSGEAGGMIKAYNNLIEGETRLVYANDDAKQFDAYLATSRDEVVPSSYKTVSGETTYNNFDTDSSVMYTYTPDAPEDVATIVTTYAGRMNGGDFEFTFNNSVDDTSYSVNAKLMSALKSYKTDLVSVGGNSVEIEGGGMVDAPETDAPEESIPEESTPEESIPEESIPEESTPEESTPEESTPEESTPEESTPEENIPGDDNSTEDGSTSDKEEADNENGTPDDSETEEITYLHDFTSDGKTSDFFKITGSLSSSKGTVTYNGLKLTQCLKMESSTSITFKTDSEAELVLIANSSCNKKIEIDGTAYAFKNGVLTVTLKAGNHTIKKEDSNVNLYYVSLIQK